MLLIAEVKKVAYALDLGCPICKTMCNHHVCETLGTLVGKPSQKPRHRLIQKSDHNRHFIQISDAKKIILCKRNLYGKKMLTKSGLEMAKDGLFIMKGRIVHKLNPDVRNLRKASLFPG